jgi:hypothetical protein
MLLVVFSYKAELQRLVLVLLAALAWWRGAGPEKASATVLLIFLTDPLDHWLNVQGIDYNVVALRDFVIDCVVAGLLTAIALRANRIYTLWMAAWQLLAVLSHLGRFESSSSAALAYAILMYTPSYLLLITLGLGLAAHMRRVKKQGDYRSWWNDCPPWRPVTSRMRI